MSSNIPLFSYSMCEINGLFIEHLSIVTFYN